MKRILEGIMVLLVFAIVVLTLVILALYATSNQHYRPQATLALNRMAMSANILGDIGPIAQPDQLSGYFTGQAVAVLDESLRHLEGMHPSPFDLKAWQVHIAFMVKFRECRKYLDLMNAAEVVTTSDFAVLADVCDPIPEDDQPNIPQGGGSEITVEQ